MRFLHPAGLWALLGLAALVLMHLLRRRYEERMVSSAYLWRLSERFLKKRLPVRRLKKTLIFALEALVVVTAAMLIAQPLIALPGSGTEYIAIIDLSGSMRIADLQGITRLDRTRERVLDHVRSLPLGSSVTVLCAGAPNVRLCEGTQSVRAVERALEGVECGYGNDAFSEALAIAQDVLWEKPDAQVYLYTDREAASAQNLTVINVAGADEWNAAITALDSQPDGDGTRFRCTAVSYGRDGALTLALYVDGALKGARTLSLTEGEPAETEWVLKNVKTFANAQVRLEADDGLSEDNQFWLFAPPVDSIRALLVSSEPFYVQNALAVFGKVELDVAITPEAAELSGYDIYVFDGCVPASAPTDGSMWYLNPPQAPPDTRLELGGELRGARVSVKRRPEEHEAGVLVRDLLFQSVSVRRFREVLAYGEDTPVLTCGAYPVLLAGQADNGTKRLTLLFDLHDANLPLMADYVVLVRNMLDYCMPPMLDRLEQTAGEPVDATVLPLTEAIYLSAADGAVRVLPFGEGRATFTADAPGAYTLLQQRLGENSRFCDFFVRMPASESTVHAAPIEQALTLTLGVDEGRAGSNALFNPLRYLAILMLVLLICECVVYHHEQS